MKIVKRAEQLGWWRYWWGLPAREAWALLRKRWECARSHHLWARGHDTYVPATTRPGENWVREVIVCGYCGWWFLSGPKRFSPYEPLFDGWNPKPGCASCSDWGRYCPDHGGR